MSSIGERLRKARERKGLTQTEVARKIGVTRSVIARYESGLNDPPSENIAKLAEIYEVSADWLLCLTDDFRPLNEIKKQPFNLDQLFQQKDEGQAYILAANLRYRYKLSDETFLKIIDEIARYYNREQKSLEGGVAAHGPETPGTGIFTREELEKEESGD